MERAALVGLFEQLGYHVLEAATPAQARRLAHGSGRIHLVFLDLNLPEVGELHLARWFQALDPETRTLIAANSLWELSYHSSDSDRIPFLIKPFTPMELAWMVRRLLG
jgi:DNA-binding NtrC family response regulator